MFRRDYFRDQIEQFAAALHKVLFHKEHKQFPEAQRLMDEASRHLLGLNVRSLQALSTKDILELLTYQGVTDTGKAIVLADVLKEQGELREASGEPEETDRYRSKALDLLLAIYIIALEEKEDLSAELKPRISYLLERLGKRDFPEGVKRKLLIYYEETLAYAKAEDMLYQLLEDGIGLEQTIGQGVSFYERVRKQDNNELLKGNFSLEEAEEGMNLLKRKYVGEG
jgi:hypothetical protein